MTSIQSCVSNTPLKFQSLLQTKNLNSKPQIFYIFSQKQLQTKILLKEFIKKYRLKYIYLKDLTSNNIELINNQFVSFQKITYYTKLIQKEIQQFGNRKYIIQIDNSLQSQFQYINQNISTKFTLKFILNIFKKKYSNIQKDLQTTKINSSPYPEMVNNPKTKTIFYDSQNEICDKILSIFEEQSIQLPVPVPVICILGGPGSGKGTNCSNLVKDYGFKHISTGDLLRQYKSGQFYETINSLMSQGKLVPSNILLEIVKQQIDKLNYEGIYLLDGFPRNEQNMTVWNQVMKGFAQIQFYLYLQCSEQTMENRLLRRGKSSGRIDDNAQIIKKRFKTFQAMTIPFIQQILKNEIVLTINSKDDPEIVYKKIQQQFLKIGIKPINYQQQKPSVIFILGGPGSGKGTQCQILVNQYKFKHLSTGDLLRQQIKNQGPQALQIQSFIAEGKLVPSTILVKLMRNKIQNQGWKGRYLVDGFPRSIQNMEAWQEIMKNDLSVDALIYFDCSVETMEKRLLKRSLSSGRSDDNPVTIKKRFATFKSQTQPFLKYYEQNGRIINRINTDLPLQMATFSVKSTLKQIQMI